MEQEQILDRGARVTLDTGRQLFQFLAYAAQAACGSDGRHGRLLPGAHLHPQRHRSRYEVPQPVLP